VFRQRDRIELKTPDQIEIMRAAGLVVAQTLQAVKEQVRVGVTTAELDDCAAAAIRDAGALPSFLGYHGFPAHICTSVNHEVVHGIPGPRQLAAGDVISVDCGAIVDGWHGDAAITIFVGEPQPEVAQLSAVTETALWAGLRAARPGGRLTDISHAVERAVRAAGDYGIVEEYVGHGIGSAMHMDPSVPNYGRPGRGPRLVPGMALAVEPMVTLGHPAVAVQEDDWTVVTADGGWAAHWEHTVAITEEGPWVLTSLDGEILR
jgi:methionyl aminopeptidase